MGRPGGGGRLSKSIPTPGGPRAGGPPPAGMWLAPPPVASGAPAPPACRCAPRPPGRSLLAQIVFYVMDGRAALYGDLVGVVASARHQRKGYPAARSQLR